MEMRIGYKLTMVFGACLAAILLAMMLFTTGCGTFGGDADELTSAYRAGRIFVFMDVTTSPIQPEKMQDAVQVVYDIALNELVNTDLTDQVVMGAIEQRYPDATPEYRQVLFNLYKNMTIALLDQVNLNPDIPETEVAGEFFRGVREALALYAPTEGTEIDEILNSMEASQ